MNVKAYEVLISVKFIKREGKVFQHFVFSSKKGSKYLIDKRYLLYDKFEEKIAEYSLSNNKDMEFISRKNENDRVILEFENKTNHSNFKNFFFVVAGFVPPNPGCDFCEFNQKENGFVFCDFMQKHLSKRKTCKFFRQKRGLFST